MKRYRTKETFEAIQFDGKNGLELGMVEKDGVGWGIEHWPGGAWMKAEVNQWRLRWDGGEVDWVHNDDFHAKYEAVPNGDA